MNKSIVKLNVTFAIHVCGIRGKMHNLTID